MSVTYFYDDSEPVPFRYLTPTRRVGPLVVPYATNLSPDAYIEFAIEDAASDTSRGLINAFSNMKRGMHLLIDSLLNQYGLFLHFRSANFPGKLRVLDEVGLIPIRIMQNLNLERNVLEHEYSTPTKQRVTEAIDVAKLLLMATEKLAEATPHEVVAGWRSPRVDVLIRLEPQRGRLDLFRIWAKGHRHRGDGISYIAGGIRDLRGELYSWIRVGKTPWRSIVLDRANRDEWLPVIKELVNIQRKSLHRKTFIAPESASVTMSITIPVSLPEGLTWNQLLDNKSKERVKADGESVGTGADRPSPAIGQNDDPNTNRNPQ